MLLFTCLKTILKKFGLKVYCTSRFLKPRFFFVYPRILGKKYFQIQFSKFDHVRQRFLKAFLSFFSQSQFQNLDLKIFILKNLLKKQIKCEVLELWRCNRLKMYLLVREKIYNISLSNLLIFNVYQNFIKYNYGNLWLCD